MNKLVFDAHVETSAPEMFFKMRRLILRKWIVKVNTSKVRWLEHGLQGYWTSCEVINVLYYTAVC